MRFFRFRSSRARSSRVGVSIPDAFASPLRTNKEWMSPTDPDARVTKMKDGRTHLAHKAEHAADLDTGAVVAVTLQEADKGDTSTMDLTLCEAGEAVAELAVREAELHPDVMPRVNVTGIEETVADKGYHSGAALERVKSYGCAVIFRSGSRRGSGTGKASPHSSKRCTRIGGGCKEATARAC